MRDAAAAAAMSDPERNRWFRRRWSDGTDGVVTIEASPVSPEPAVVDLNLLGHELLLQWRRERADKAVVP